MAVLFLRDAVVVAVEVIIMAGVPVVVQRAVEELVAEAVVDVGQPAEEGGVVVVAVGEADRGTGEIKSDKNGSTLSLSGLWPT